VIAARACERLERDDLGGAIAEATRAIDQDSRVALAYAVRGAARARKGETAPALQDLTRAIDLDPRSSLAFTERGTLRHATDPDPRNALADLKRAVTLDPTSVAASAELALVELELGKLVEGTIAADRAVKAAPASPKALVAIALAEMRWVQWEDAEKHASRAIELAPDDPRTWSCRADLFALKGGLVESARDSARAAELAKAKGRAAGPDALARVNSSLLVQDREGKATKAIENNPGVAWFYLYRAEIKAVFHDPKADNSQALADTRAAVKLEPRWPKAVLLLARLLKTYEPANLATFKLAAELNPDSGLAHSLLGIALVETGQFKDSVPWLLRSDELVPNDADNLYHLAFAYQNLGESDRALAVCDRLLDHYKDHPVVLRFRAEVRLSRGELDSALADLTRLCELEPGNADFQGDRIAVLRVLGRSDAAEAWIGSLPPGDRPSWVPAVLGCIRARRGDLAGARVALEEASRVSGDARTELLRGLILAADRDAARARAAFERASDPSWTGVVNLAVRREARAELEKLAGR
jgi:tetratricopeptide (TPR) repeat protein